LSLVKILLLATAFALRLSTLGAHQTIVLFMDRHLLEAMRLSGKDTCQGLAAFAMS
jgi:hypothetical protein